MGMERIFYHGIFWKGASKAFNSCETKALEIMLEIIETGGLKSRRLQGVTSAYGFNGDDYISICSKEDEQAYSKYPINAFYGYIQNNFCFIISDDIPAIRVRYNEVNSYLDFMVISDLMRKCPEQRFSDMFDEWQVKDEISLRHIIGIGIPFDKVDDMVKTNKNYQMKLSQLINLAEQIGLDIVNTSDAKEIDAYEKKVLSLDKVKRKLYE